MKIASRDTIDALVRRDGRRAIKAPLTNVRFSADGTPSEKRPSKMKCSISPAHRNPATDLPPVAGLARDGKPVRDLAAVDFRGTVTVLNVWASWCVPCHDKAPLLMQLARDSRIRRLVDVNYKDQADNPRRLRGRDGNSELRASM